MLSVTTHMDHTLAHVKLAITAMENDALVRLFFAQRKVQRNLTQLVSQAICVENQYFECEHGLLFTELNS